MHILLNIFCSGRKSVPRLVHYENLRWFRRPRKPFWLGTAPSKKFVVKEPEQLPKIESDELERLNYAYNRQYRSLMNFMKGNTCVLVDDSDRVNVDVSIALSLKRNDEWNIQSSILRKEREEREAKELEERLEEEVKIGMENKKMLQRRINKIIDEEIALSKTIITPENLDEAIDNCLEKVVEHNFAIDVRGNIYKGKDTTLIPEEKLINEEEKERNQIVSFKSCTRDK